MDGEEGRAATLAHPERTAVGRYPLRLRLSRAAVGLIHEGKTGTSAIKPAAEYRAVSTAKVQALPEPDA